MTKEFRYVGKGMLPKGGAEIVTGKTVFTDDIKLGHMLHVKMLRSPFQHAKIEDIDTSRAEILPGVVTTLSYKDIYKYIPKRPMLDGSLVQSHTVYPLSREVFYVGEEVAAVAAENEEIAEDALDLIEVKYEKMLGISEPEEAMKQNAPLVHSTRDNNLVPNVVVSDMTWGDAGLGIKEAEIILEGKYSSSVETHASLETNCLLCEWRGEELIVYATTQTPAKVRVRIARALAIPENRIRVIVYRIGGGFGGKASGVTESRLGTILAVLSKKSGRPVKIRLTMAEKIACVTTRYPSVASLKASAKKDGSLCTLQGQVIMSEGAHSALQGQTSGVALARFDTYRFPHRNVHAQSVYTNRVPSSPMRPWMGGEGFWMSEIFFDELAEKLDEDPLEFRRKNIIRAGDKVFLYGAFPKGEGLLKGGDPPSMIKLAADKFAWGDKWKGWGKTVQVSGSKVRSIGMAAGHTTGGGILSDTVIIKVDCDGSVIVAGSSPDLGQGISTAISQVVADALGVSPEMVVYVTDTKISGYAHGTAAQRGTPLTIGAARLAAEDAKRQLLELASKMLELKPEEMDIEDGSAFVKADPRQSMSIPSILFDRGSYRTVVGTGYARACYYTRDPVMGLPLAERSFHVGFAEVEVDTETGQVRILKAVQGIECGRVLNPAILEQQMEGGFIMGLHYALTEGIICDKRDGSILNTSLTDYKLPTILDFPPLENVISSDPAHAPTCVSYNAKGCTEGPVTYVSPMLLNAVYNAIGIRIHEGPLTPDNVLNSMGKIK